jgi:hypothetical protein
VHLEDHSPDDQDAKREDTHGGLNEVWKSMRSYIFSASCLDGSALEEHARPESSPLVVTSGLRCPCIIHEVC